MKLQIAIRSTILLAYFGLARSLFAQASCENPLEYAALTEGNILINNQISAETEGQIKTAALQNAIAVEFDKIHAWEAKYSSYTQTVSGYASSLNAASHIYDDALKILLTIGDLRTSIEDNPQGIVATMSMNTLYVEAATELVSCFTLIRNAVARGGESNMLTGAERSQILWAINDKLDSFSKKLQRLALSIRFYRMRDVWESYSAGMIDRNHGDVAVTAHSRWIQSAHAIR